VIVLTHVRRCSAQSLDPRSSLDAAAPEIVSGVLARRVDADALRTTVDSMRYRPPRLPSALDRRALHHGKLSITGEAPNVIVTWLVEPETHVGHQQPNKLALAAMQVEAKQALVQLGFKATQARAAIDRAGPHEALVREALRQLR
jgi:hypothetical protein